jgi:hypothetical protein
MIRKCYVCKKVFGTKEPLEDKRITHGLCDHCFIKEKQKIERELYGRGPSRPAAPDSGAA